MRIDGDRLHLQGAITISRPSGGDGEYVMVRVEDRASRATVCELQVPLEQFALAITGRGNAECTMDVWPVGLARLGLVRQNDTRTLVFSADSEPSGEDEWRQLVDTTWRAQFPDDPEQGWAIFALDRRPNPHRRGRTEEGHRTYQVTIERYVPTTVEP